ncbi:MAG TPA: Ig-like domain-containing protein [Candidatus Thermoplasmatota archaeon]|nr:Ig-like domain-containing protein [Candidatus Thermoplasmatota archaeon]
MRVIIKLLVVIVVVVLIGATAYGVYNFENETNGNNNDHDHENNETDTEPPTITYITGDTTVIAGQTVTISAEFADNVGVTDAVIYYKSADATSWINASILSGYATISIPSTAVQDYYYYVIVNDAAGNGPVGDPSTDGSVYYTITVQPAGGDQGNETLTHTVFIEEATATWCTNCPNVANILASLYDSHKYNFYYVALIDDKSQLAKERDNEYNLYSFPMAYFDGGYKIVVGGDKPTSLYTDAINASLARTVPKIRLTVTAQYSNNTKKVTVTTKLENFENTTYTGNLRLYLTEIISEFNDYESKPYHFGLVDYVNNTNISVNGNSVLTFSDTKDISAYDYENLMVIGVVFSSKNHTGYSNPPTGNPFDAYYADATNATPVVPKGNLPPQLQITSPLKGNIYWNGKALSIVGKIIERKHFFKKLANISLLKEFLYNKTFLLGKTKVFSVDATDDSAVAKVEFYIDGVLQKNVTKAPYEYSFTTKLLNRKLFLHSHTLKVIVYDDMGKTTSASLVFKARF